MSDQLPNNPLKLPLLIVCAVVDAALAIFFVVNGVWGLALITAVGAVVCVPSILVVRSGRNPWWVRGPLDRWWQQHKKR